MILEAKDDDEYENICKEITSWYSNSTKMCSNIKRQQLLIIDNFFLSTENSLLDMLQDVPKICIFKPKKFIFKRLIYLSFENFDSSIHKIIFVNDFTLNFLDYIKNFSQMNDLGLEYLKIPSIFVLRERIYMTRNIQEKLESIFKIIYIKKGFSCSINLKRKKLLPLNEEHAESELNKCYINKYFDNFFSKCSLL